MGGEERGILSGLITLEGLERGRLTHLLDRAESYVNSPRGWGGVGKSSRGGVGKSSWGGVVGKSSWGGVVGKSSSTEFAGATVTTAFFEASTRTRLSFEQAASHLGADVMSFNPELSSATKGESFKDTILTLTAIGTDVFVIRHRLADAADLAARWSGRPVINGGLGSREHPTQTLADALTLRQEFGGLEGLRMAIVGDIRNSRVARGHLIALPALGVDITLVGPTSFLPPANPWGVRTSNDLDDELGDVDVVYLLRIQAERGSSAGIPSITGYARRFGMNHERLSMMKPTAVVMHPGPMNRGVEIDDVTADGERSLILRQVANGVPVRMAVIAEALEGGA